MAVYVDDMEAGFGRMVMCHMVADSVEELLAMADRIGVARRWVQHADDPVRIHFDIAKSKRALAVQAGAIEVTWRWVGKRHNALRKGEPLPPIEQPSDAVRQRSLL